MNIHRIPALALAAVLLASPTIASASPDTTATPNSCITANGGDWNACNVGNSGQGDLPYRPAGR